jgi:hypothetical protein
VGSVGSGCSTIQLRNLQPKQYIPWIVSQNPREKRTDRARSSLIPKEPPSDVGRVRNRPIGSVCDSWGREGERGREEGEVEASSWMRRINFLFCGRGSGEAKMDDFERGTGDHVPPDGAWGSLEGEKMYVPSRSLKEVYLEVFDATRAFMSPEEDGMREGVRGIENDFASGGRGRSGFGFDSEVEGREESSEREREAWCAP